MSVGASQRQWTGRLGPPLATRCGEHTFGRDADNRYPVLVLCVSVMHLDWQVAVPQLVNNIAEDIACTAFVCFGCCFR